VGFDSFIAMLALLLSLTERGVSIEGVVLTGEGSGETTRGYRLSDNDEGPPLLVLHHRRCCTCKSACLME